MNCPACGTKIKLVKRSTFDAICPKDKSNPHIYVYNYKKPSQFFQIIREKYTFIFVTQTNELIIYSKLKSEEEILNMIQKEYIFISLCKLSDEQLDSKIKLLTTFS